MKLAGKVIVVTGGGSGIGKELVLALLKKGANVAAVDLHEDTLKELQESVGENSKNLSIHTADISDKTAVEKLPNEIIAEHDTVDGLIHCAGIIQPFVRINDLDYKSIERVMNVNFYGTLYMTKSFLPHLLKRPEAHIANVSSMGGFLPVPGQAVYGASKAAVKLMTEGLYAELLDTNVNVSIIFPGATSTNITKNSGVDIPSSTSKRAQSFKMLPASDAAKQIINGIEKNKFQIFLGKDSKSMNKLYRLSPGFATRFIAKKMRSLLSR